MSAHVGPGSAGGGAGVRLPAGHLAVSPCVVPVPAAGVRVAPRVGGGDLQVGRG